MAAHPGIDVRSAARRVSLGPRPRPAVLGSEFGKTAPVAQRQIGGIADALAALLRQIDKEHAAKAFARQPAEHAFLVAVEEQHGPAAVEQVERGGDAGDTAADDQYFGPVHAVARLPIPSREYHGFARV